MEPTQERVYIQQALADPRAFVHLYDRYFERVHAYVRYRVRSQQDAEDIIAEVFLRALRGLEGFTWSHDNAFAAWLFRIAHNLLVDHYRRREQAEVPFDARGSLPETRREAQPVLTSRPPQPEKALTQKEAFQRMQGLVSTLSPRRQEVITLRFFGGLRNKEIANVLELDERTIASHLSRGLQDLRDEYAREASTKVLQEVTG